MLSSAIVWAFDLMWSEVLWLPSGVKWEDIRNDPDKKVTYPDTSDTWYQLPLTAFFLVLRYVLERFCFSSLGKALGIRGKKRNKLKDILQLEKAYRATPQNKDMAGLAKLLDMSERQVERWWRDRCNLDKASPIAKFCEHMWRASYMGFISAYGFYVLYDKEWFWNMDLCFVGYPHQGVTTDIWWFYMICTSYYWSSLLTYFRDVKRKDHWQMFLHHATTLTLLWFSWVLNIHRFGACMVPYLESSDAAVEVVKAMKRAKFDRSATWAFHIFASIWFYTRLYIYPVYFLYRITFQAPKFIALPAVTMGIALLYTLMLLTIYWSYVVLKVILNHIAYGIIHDVRSSSSEVLDDCRSNEHQIVTNGKEYLLT